MAKLFVFFLAAALSAAQTFETPYDEMSCNASATDGQTTLHKYDGRAACCDDLDQGTLDTFLYGLSASAIETACNSHGFV
mmetsp:Transcript_7430/g.21981  ORF Transcript_7430/g.21981 Transcript_7430/m.21981 type:complete len:80 (-) Transcript_7430:68-307(-)